MTLPPQKSRFATVPLTSEHELTSPGSAAEQAGTPSCGGHSFWSVAVTGPLNTTTAEAIVRGTAEELPWLTAVFPTDDGATNAAEELLLRTIWHLQLAGFQAGRQQNPSGAISKDKLTIMIDGSWHSYDVYSLGYAGRATTVQFMEVWPPNYVPSPGIPD